jgi:hypothetical protein
MRKIAMLMRKIAMLMRKIAMLMRKIAIFMKKVAMLMRNIAILMRNIAILMINIAILMRIQPIESRSTKCKTQIQVCSQYKGLPNKKIDLLQKSLNHPSPTLPVCVGEGARF